MLFRSGSHNLGTKASRANDDNLIIVEGPGARGLAIAFAVNIIAIYQEYRWRNYVAQHASDRDVWHALQDNETWQAGHLTKEKDELQFWIGSAKVGAQSNQAKIIAAAAPPAPVTSSGRAKKKARAKKTSAKKGVKSAAKTATKKSASHKR